MILLRWNAHRKIRQTFKEAGYSVTRIRQFNGFLDLGSIREALTTFAYYVTTAAPDGRVSEQLCTGRYTRVVGIVHSVSIWPESGKLNAAEIAELRCRYKEGLTEPPKHDA